MSAEAQSVLDNTRAYASVGVVTIGRNEGERLARCLRALPKGVAQAVYVDSGSTDGSVELARSLGVEVVALDMSTPFTAARARNTGVARLRELRPEVEHVLLLDGDCELVPGFLDVALALLQSAPDVGVVAGRRRELFPEASVYNRLCDMEWNTPVGEAEACGGDALIRIAAFQAVGGYDPTLIAGEEPEMCRRMRRAGFRILRIDRDMTRHDAAMTKLSQWWMRNVRAGHASAEAFHRDPESGFDRRMVRSNFVWGLGVPATSVLLALPTLGASFGLLGLYGVLWWRIRESRLGMQHDSPANANVFAAYCALGKLPQLSGTLRFYRNLRRGQRSALIEYKSAG